MSNEKQDSSQTIDELQKRFQSLNEEKIKVETQREHALAQLDELKAQSRELFGSDDVGQLEKMLKEMKVSNEQKRSQYESALDAIDADLAAINDKFFEDDVE